MTSEWCSWYNWFLWWWWSPLLLREWLEFLLLFLDKFWAWRNEFEGSWECTDCVALPLLNGRLSLSSSSPWELNIDTSIKIRFEYGKNSISYLRKRKYELWISLKEKIQLNIFNFENFNEGNFNQNRFSSTTLQKPINSSLDTYFSTKSKFKFAF